MTAQREVDYLPFFFFQFFHKFTFEKYSFAELGITSNIDFSVEGEG